MRPTVEPVSALHRLVQESAEGDGTVSPKLAEALYGELHAAAVRMMASHGDSHTLQATALVHEAWLRLRKQGEWTEPAHFLAAAARAMRSVLVDHTRAKNSAKRGGNWERLPLDDLILEYEDRAIDLVELDMAIERMAGFDPQMAKAVELRFFGALGIDETARALNMPKRTFERHWHAARNWLYAELG